MQEPIRVLVVEDDLEVAAAIARRLEGGGARVTTAYDPLRVMAELEGALAPWDVLLLDVNLPTLSGLDVLERMRAAGSLVSVVMLTGDDSARTATACMSGGAFYYLTKPFRPAELAAIVDSAARYARLRAESVRRATPDVDPVPEAIAPKLKGTHAAFFDGGEVISLAEGKKAAAATFEREYLTRVMWIARGSIAEAARLAGIDRTNFRRLLQRHKIDATEFR